MTGDDDRLPPRANPELVGHQAAERELLAAARSGRLPHAWLIGGPPGIGKATLAFRFARFLLAGAPPATTVAGQEGDAAGLALAPEHPVFRRVAAGGHADLLTVERPYDEKRKRMTTELPVEQVRRIAPFLRLTSAEGGWRVVVVDEAERMSRSSANAVLKVLEEPPDRAVLLLVSNSPGALLPTLRSRCRRLMLEPLDEAAVAGWLARRAPDLPAADRAAVARLAQGSIGRALQLIDQGGLDHYRSLIGLLDTLPRLDLARVHKLGDQLAPAAAEESYRTFVELLLWWLRRLIRVGSTGEAPAEIVAGEAALMGRLAGGGLDPWLEVWEKIDGLVRRADSANLDRKQVILFAFGQIEAAARA